MSCSHSAVDTFNAEISRFTAEIAELTTDISNYNEMITNATASSDSLGTALTHLDSASEECVGCLSDGGNPVDKGYLSKKITEIGETKAKIDINIIPTLNSDRTNAINQKRAAEENLARCIIQRDQAQSSYDACVAAEAAAAAAAEASEYRGARSKGH